MPLLFATDPDAAAIGTFIQILFWICGAIGGIAVAVASVVVALRKPEKASGENYVTHAELTREMGRLEADIKELRVYTRDRTHDLGQRLHVVNLRIVWMMSLLVQMCDKQGIVVPPQPSISPGDET